MARDFEDLHDLDDLSDDELRELVISQLAAHHGIDPDDVSVTVEDGVVHLGGRVGTDEERQVAEHVVTDVLGIEQLENEIFVDPIRRADSPEAVDEHLAGEEQTEGLLLGDRPVPLSPEAEHLSDEVATRVQAFGTHDVQAAIAEGATYVPPEQPTPEGYEGVIPREGGDHAAT
jgi:BON domain-containing protein